MSNYARLLLLPVLCATLAACKPAASPPPVIEVMATDYAFVIPPKIPAGLVTLNFVNHGKELHFASIQRLSKDVTMDQIRAKLDSPEPPDFIDESQGGQVGLVSPGESAQVTVKLVPGKYFIACWIPAPDHAPHAAKGMTSIIEVVDDKAGERSEPASSVAIALKQTGVDLPKEFKAGKQTWKIVNETGNAQANGIDIVQLAGGKSFEEAEVSLNQGDFSPIAAAFGGAGGAGPSNTAWLTVDLKPGDYWLHTNVPDPAAPAPAKDQSPKTISLKFTVK